MMNTGLTTLLRRQDIKDMDTILTQFNNKSIEEKCEFIQNIHNRNNIGKKYISTDALGFIDLYEMMKYYSCLDKVTLYNNK